MFDQARLDQYSAKEVFAIENIEQRRIAYELMDKVKMKALDNYKILESKKDKYKNPMKVITFELPGYKQPFLYYNCICPSTGREYFVETKQKTCKEAKSMGWGFKEFEFDDEY